MAKILICADDPLEVALVLDMISCICNGKEYKLRSIVEVETGAASIKTKCNITLETEPGLIGKFLKSIEGLATGSVTYMGGNQCNLKIH